MGTTPINRMATGSQLDIMQAGLRKLQEDMAQREAEISSGQRGNVPSDAPLAAVRSMAHQAASERADQYLRNIDLASGEMNSADGVLDGLNGIADRAREILLSQISDTSTTQTRQNAAAEVGQLIQSATDLANRQFAGRYLLAGRDGQGAPVEMVGDLAAFRSSSGNAPQVEIGVGRSVARSATAPDGIGAAGAAIQGSVDLDPRLTATTRISDLHRGAGVRLGSLTIEDGLGGTATVDLSGAETVADVISRINATGLATASVNAA